jgi:hypothetical protein
MERLAKTMPAKIFHRKGLRVNIRFDWTYALPEDSGRQNFISTSRIAV